MRTTSGMEPSGTARDGGSALRTAGLLFLATRPMFFPASVLPVLLGTGWGYRVSGQLDLGSFGLALAAMVCVHAGVNVINDVYDDICGTDRVNPERISPYTGGSRFIQNGTMTTSQMTGWAVILFAIAVVIGAILFAAKGVGVVLFGLTGATLGVLYSMPPMRLSARGLGEAAVGLGFGILPVTGAAWLQSGSLGVGALLLSLPVSLWVANILLVNEVPDAEADGATGRRTLVVRLGPRGTWRVYLVLNGLAVGCVMLSIAAGLLPVAAIAAPLALGLASIPAARGIGRTDDRRLALTRSIKITLAIHGAGTLWLAGWVWVA